MGWWAQGFFSCQEHILMYLPHLLLHTAKQLIEKEKTIHKTPIFFLSYKKKLFVYLNIPPLTLS